MITSHNMKSRTTPKVHPTESIQKTATIIYMIYLKIVSEYDKEIPQSQTETNLWHPEEEQRNNHETQ